MQDPRPSAPPEPHLSPAQKLDTAMRLYWTARELKTAALRDRHPDWDEAQIEAEVRRIFLLAGDG